MILPPRHPPPRSLALLLPVHRSPLALRPAVVQERPRFPRLVPLRPRPRLAPLVSNHNPRPRLAMALVLALARVSPLAPFPRRWRVLRLQRRLLTLLQALGLLALAPVVDLAPAPVLVALVPALPAPTALPHSIRRARHRALPRRWLRRSRPRALLATSRSFGRLTDTWVLSALDVVRTRVTTCLLWS